MRLLSGDLPQIEGHTYSLRSDQHGEYPDDDWARAFNPDLSWPGIVLAILAAPLFVVSEWWRRVRG